jgi:hypothetical protein
MVGTTIGLILAASAAAGGSVASAAISSNAAKSAAAANAAALEKSTALQTTAQTHAADVQTSAADKALAFERQQAAYDASVAETNRKANYDQYVDRQSMLGSVGEALGLPHRNISPYTPLPASPYALTPGDALGQPKPTAPGAPPAGGDPRDPAFINAQLQGVYKQLGVAPTGPGSGPTDIAYMAGKVADTGGWTPANASYWPGRIAEELAKANGGTMPTQPAPSSSAPRPMGTPFGGTVADYMQQAPITGYLRMPQTPIGQPVGAYL